jgi:hypothetical protein
LRADEDEAGDWIAGAARIAGGDDDFAKRKIRAIAGLWLLRIA